MQWPDDALRVIPLAHVSCGQGLVELTKQSRMRQLAYMRQKTDTKRLLFMIINMVAQLTCYKPLPIHDDAYHIAAEGVDVANCQHFWLTEGPVFVYFLIRTTHRRRLLQSMLLFVDRSMEGWRHLSDLTSLRECLGPI
jgi:hypothetical protein